MQSEALQREGAGCGRGDGAEEDGPERGNRAGHSGDPSGHGSDSAVHKLRGSGNRFLFSQKKQKQNKKAEFRKATCVY